MFPPISRPRKWQHLNLTGSQNLTCNFGTTNYTNMILSPVDVTGAGVMLKASRRIQLAGCTFQMSIALVTSIATPANAGAYLKFGYALYGDEMQTNGTGPLRSNWDMLANSIGAGSSDEWAWPVHIFHRNSGLLPCSQIDMLSAEALCCNTPYLFNYPVRRVRMKRTLSDSQCLNIGCTVANVNTASSALVNVTWCVGLFYRVTF